MFSYFQSDDMIEFPKNKKIILFDGICNLCNNSVLSVIKYDKKNTFIFASLQSETGKEILKHLNINNSKIDSIILYEPGLSYDIKSTAVLKIIKHFGGFWNILQIAIFLPEFFRNHIYDYIAKNRYKWFGKRQKCMLPSTELEARFLH